MSLIKWITRKSVGPETISLLRFYNNAKADKMFEVLGGAPDSVLANTNSAPVNVGQGSLCRVFGTTSTLVAFGPDDTLAVPMSTTQNAVQLSQACMIIVATDNFIRTTSDVTRVEVFKE